jgi:hypothetical protein
MKKKITVKKSAAKRTASKSSALARKRGAEYENEVAAALQTFLGRPVKRKLGQARDSGYDIDCGPLRVECKRRRDIGWLGKALTQINKWVGADEASCVVTRGDGGKSVVVMELDRFLELLGKSLLRGTDVWE